ncbi:MAG: glycosyltransferase family 2 protein [Oscillospiraceae bacterium]
MSKLSIVIPVYFNESNLRPLYDDLKAKILDSAKFEIEVLLVDDGSEDRSWEIIEELCKEDNRLRGIHLSRNFGSHSAMLCGLSESTGDCAVIKAADLQEPTEIILDMFESWQKGNNVVLAVRAGRDEKASTTFFANFYYKLTQKMALPQMPDTGFDVFLLDRKVIEVLERMDERNSAITGQILWSGFKTGKIYYTRKEREIGKSRWTLKKKIRLVSDTLFGFSSVPITAVSVIGIVSCSASLLWSIVVLVNRLLGDIPVAGFTTLFIFQLFSFGIIMLTLGILGGYLWRSFDASRNRPVYIVENRTDKKN